jgi:hypothetical protein
MVMIQLKNETASEVLIEDVGTVLMAFETIETSADIWEDIKDSADMIQLVSAGILSLIIDGVLLSSIEATEYLQSSSTTTPSNSLGSIYVVGNATEEHIPSFCQKHVHFSGYTLEEGASCILEEGAQLMILNSL